MDSGDRTMANKLSANELVTLMKARSVEWSLIGWFVAFHRNA